MPANQWIIFALGSAFFAALTAILGKIGVAEINSNLATFIRTALIVGMTALIVTANQQWEPLSKLSKPGLLALVGSAFATGLSWLCYYRALQLAPAAKVAPLDKLSVVMVVALAALFLGEKVSAKLALGVVLMATGAVIIAL